MSVNYSNIFSPIKVKNMILKNRIVASNSLPHFLMGPEKYPTTDLIELLANRAKNGAAVVTLAHTYAPIGMKGMKIGFDTDHFPVFDMYEPTHQNYLIMLCDAIHYYGGKASLNITRPIMPEWDVIDRPERKAKAYTKEIIDQFIDAYVEQAVIARKLGFDMGSIHFAYRSSFAGAFFSAITNTRTDEYGGSLENRSKVILEIFRRIKAEVGEDFVLEGLLSVKDLPGGYTFEDTKKFAKMSEGLIDILQLRMEDGDISHPMGFHIPNPTLEYAEELKALNLKTLIEPIGGFQDPDVMEEALASGKADLIGMARPFVCDDEYGIKMREGRKEDIVPCVRCNKCHVIGHHVPYRSACTVNPQFGISSYLHRKEAPISAPKKIAVIGGGPAGMEAALVATKRGNSVTLFEKSGSLGGQMIPGSMPAFKWPIKDFLNYMVNQTEKKVIDVRLNTEATPELLEKEGFDTVFIALGTVPVMPPVKGIESANVITAHSALVAPEKVRGDVVIIGAGEVGMETGMFLADKGHNVTVLEMRNEIAPEVNPIHYRETFDEEWKNKKNLSVITEASVTEIRDNVVLYQKAGQELSLKADTVISAAGTKPLTEKALAFYNGKADYYIIGDCEQGGTIMTSMRSAYAAASQI